MLHSLWITTRLALIPMLAGALLISLFMPSWSWDNTLFHALIEGGGALIGFVLTLIVMAMIQKQRLGYNYTWLIACFLSMGLLDIAHSLMHPGQTFVWLHSCATFIGGIFAALIWLSPHLSKPAFQLNKLWLLTTLSIAFGFWSILYPESTLTMLDDNHQFTTGAKFLNITGGIGFLIAWGYFAREYHY